MGNRHRRYGNGVFVRLDPEQERFVEDLSRQGVSRQTVIRAALLHLMQSREHD